MLELKNITFAVNSDGTEKEILHSLNLVVEDRKLLVITGPNGSGKSTLLRCINLLETPSSGAIRRWQRHETDYHQNERAFGKHRNL